MSLSEPEPAASRPRQMRYTVLPDRMPPIPPEKMTEEQRAAAAEMVGGARGYLTGSYSAVIRSPRLMRQLQKVGEYVRYGCALDPRLVEMAALMAGRHWTQQYVWEAHTRAGAKCGLRQEIMDAIAEGRRPAGMAFDEEAVHDFFTEVFTNRSVSDPTYARAVAAFGEQGVVDLMGVAGYYSLLAMIMNVARTPPPRGDVLPLAPMPQQMRID